MRSFARNRIFVAVLMLAVGAAGCAITPTGSPEAQQQTIERATAAAEKARDAASKAQAAAEKARNLPSSSRREIFVNNNRYIGEVRNGMANGYGVVNVSNHTRYEGEFRNNEYWGYGVVYFLANSPTPGDRYEGQILDGRKNGYGVYHHIREGVRYDGELRNGMRHGYGIAYTTSGEAHYGYLNSNQLDQKRYAIRIEVAPSVAAKSIQDKTNTDSQAASDSNSIEAQLEKLKRLLDKGLITAEEAKAKRVKLLDEL
jgi:hypothetical protein